jgi:hypothetical protein
MSRQVPVLSAPADWKPLHTLDIVWAAVCGVQTHLESKRPSEQNCMGIGQGTSGRAHRGDAKGRTALTAVILCRKAARAEVEADRHES